MIRVFLLLSLLFALAEIQHNVAEAHVRTKCVKYRSKKCIKRIRVKHRHRKKTRSRKIKKKTTQKKASKNDEPDMLLNKGMFRIRKIFRGREYRITKQKYITPEKSSKKIKISKHKKTFVGASRCEAEANAIQYYENNLKYRKKVCKKFGDKTYCGRNHRELYLLPQVRNYFNSKDPNKKFNHWARRCQGLGGKTAFNIKKVGKWKHAYSKAFFKYFDLYGDRFVRYIDKKMGFKDLEQFCDSSNTFHEASLAQKKLFYFAIWKQIIWEESKFHSDILNKNAADPSSRCAIGFIQANPKDLIKFSNSVLDNTDDFSPAQVALAKQTVEKSDHQLVEDLMNPEESIRYGIFMADLLFNWSSNRCSNFQATLCDPRYSMARNKATYWGGLCEFWEPIQFKKARHSHLKAVRVRELANEICSRSPKGLYQVAEKMGSVGRYKYNSSNRSYYIDDRERRGITVKELELAGLTKDMVDHRAQIPLPLKKPEGLDELAAPTDINPDLSRKALEKTFTVSENSLSFRLQPNEYKKDIVCGQLKKNFNIKSVNLVERKGSKLQWLEFEVTEDVQKLMQNKECKTHSTLFIAYKKPQESSPESSKEKDQAVINEDTTYLEEQPQ